MSLTPEDVKKVAHLARLSIKETDIAPVTDKMSQVIELVDQISSVDTTGIIPMAHPLTGMIQRLRADEVTEVDERERLQAGAPSTEAGLYLVPRVVE